MHNTENLKALKEICTNFTTMVLLRTEREHNNFSALPAIVSTDGFSAVVLFKQEVLNPTTRAQFSQATHEVVDVLDLNKDWFVWTYQPVDWDGLFVAVAVAKIGTPTVVNAADLDNVDIAVLKKMHTSKFVECDIKGNERTFSIYEGLSPADLDELKPALSVVSYTAQTSHEGRNLILKYHKT